jgi:hypothetical protein
MPTDAYHLKRALEKLRRYGLARNRDVDRELRFVEITDDEAMALLQHIADLSGPPGMLYVDFTRE